MRVAVLGASGKIGSAFVRRLELGGVSTVPIGRRPERLPAHGRVADITDRVAMRAALADVTHVVNCAHARTVPALLQAIPDTVERIVVMGSTRRFTRFPDAAADEVWQAEEAVRTSDLPVAMLHPTMIYGADGENNVHRVAAIVRRTPLVALPQGGKVRLQPIHVDDVLASLEAAMRSQVATREALVIGGPEPITYADLVRSVGAAVGRRTRIVPFPVAPLLRIAGLTKRIPWVPTVTPAEVQRLVEHKDVDVEPMQRLLGVAPMSFRDGLQRTFAHETVPAASLRVRLAARLQRA